MCYDCHKKDAVCSCDVAGDTEDGGSAGEDDDPSDEEWLVTTLTLSEP